MSTITPPRLSPPNAAPRRRRVSALWICALALATIAAATGCKQTAPPPTAPKPDSNAAPSSDVKPSAQSAPTTPGAGQATGNPTSPQVDPKPDPVGGQDPLSGAPTGQAPVAEGACSQVLPTALHCALTSDDPKAQTTIACCTRPCMDPVKTFAQDLIVLRKEGGDRVETSVASDGGCLTITAAEPLAPSTWYSLELPRFGVRTVNGATATIANGAESIGRYTVCVNPSEDTLARRSPDNLANRCKPERDREAMRPAWFRSARAFFATRSYVARKDNYTDIDGLNQAFEPTSRVPASTRPEQPLPPVITMTFRDGSGTELGSGRLYCDGWVCFNDAGQDPKDGACYEGDTAALNTYFTLEGRGCRTP